MLTFLVLLSISCIAQSGTESIGKYPKEIRGYKVAQAKVTVRKAASPFGSNSVPFESAESDVIVQVGEPVLDHLSPLGITFNLPVMVSALKQGGSVDFISFENIVVNGAPVTIDDYNRSFELPTKEPALMPVPIPVFVSFSEVVLGKGGNWNDSKPLWPVSGTVYVFGRFKKMFKNFKRVVPFEFNIEIPNPMRKKSEHAKSGQGSGSEPTAVAVGWHTISWQNRITS